MIYIDGQLCYSPEPPEVYTREDVGHGVWVHGDLPTWNLVWLSFPQLDLYLDETVNLADVVKSIDSDAFGKVLAAASPELEEYLEGLRPALRKVPDKFYLFAGEFDWERVIAYQALGEPWVTTMRRRAQEAMTMQRKISEDVAKFMQNVIKVDFKKGRAA